jgi:hypothetical protein
MLAHHVLTMATLLACLMATRPVLASCKWREPDRTYPVGPELNKRFRDIILNRLLLTPKA